MASLLFPKGLTRQLVAILLLVALAGIVGVSLAAWRAERQALEAQVNSKLAAVANLKRERLNSWFTERQADARLIAVNRLNQEHFTELFDSSVPQDRKNEFSAFLRDNLVGLQQSRAGYLSISMTDKDGNVVIGTDAEQVGHPALAQDVVKVRIPSIGGGFFCDMYPDPNSGRPLMVFGHVIRALDLHTHRATTESIGEVIIVVDMAETIYRLLGPLPELGHTAEAFLVRPTADGMLYLSPLLYVDNAPLRLSAGLNSSIGTEMGSVDAFRAVDYFNQPVIAVYRQIEPVGWGLVVKQAESEAFAPIYELARRIALLTVLVLLGTALLAFFLARTLTRPIGALAQATQAIAAGDLSVSLQETRNDELGALSASFQQMVEALTERKQETERLTKMLRRRADELESAYGDLRRSDQLKDAFIRNITHELRTPVATLSGFTELLMDDADEFSPEQSEMLAAIASQSLQITRLVNDVVALHNVHANNDERRPLRLVEMLRASLEACRQQQIGGETGMHRFELICADDDTQVLAHPGQMTRVIDNLLDNAVKFSPESGLISVQIRRIQKKDQDGLAADWQVVSVSDTGIGIAPEDLTQIWERFYQADRSTTRRFGGAGLGLALVKEVVESHGGKVWADSLLGEGTIVSFCLPVYQPVASGEAGSVSAQS